MPVHGAGRLLHPLMPSTRGLPGLRGTMLPVTRTTDGVDSPVSPASLPEGARLACLVSMGGVSRMVALPDEGEARIGRGADQEIQIEDSSVSRQHAVLEITAGGVVFLRDLGSRNGTRLRGRRVETRELVSPGDMMQVGRAVLVLSSSRPTRANVCSSDEWRFRLLEEAERAERAGQPLSVLVARASGTDGVSVLLELASGCVRAVDSVCHFVGPDVQLLLPGTPRSQAEECLRRLRAACKTRGLPVTCAVASAPDEGRDAFDLLVQARAQLGDRRKVKPAPREPRFASSTIQRALHQVKLYARGDIPILLLGETGSGKEVFAQLVHAHSPRAKQRFVSVNCATLRGELVDDLLFGHCKGAFTGAGSDQAGVFEHAHEGTLFLDELGELPLSTQATILRALEEGQVSRLGDSTRAFPADVRFVAATNRDLETMARQGTFRLDLLHRIQGATVRIPPLRERPDDVLALSAMFLEQACDRMGIGRKRIAESTLRALLGHAWPGNVRELKNVIERASLLAAEATEVQPEHLGLTASPLSTTGSFDAVPVPSPSGALLEAESAAVPPSPLAPEPAAPAVSPAEAPRDPAHYRALLVTNERAALVAVLSLFGNNQTKAAEFLDIPRRTFVNMLGRHGLLKAQTRQAKP